MRKTFFRHLADLAARATELSPAEMNRSLRTWVVSFGSATDDNKDAARALRVHRREISVGRPAVSVGDLIHEIEGMDDVVNRLARRFSVSKNDVHAALRLNVLLWSAWDESIGPNARRVSNPWRVERPERRRPRR